MTTRGRKCTACDPSKRDEVDHERLEGRSIRDIAGHHDLSKSAVGRHSKGHLPQRLTRAQAAEEVADADSLLTQAQRLLADAKDIHAEAMGAFDHKTALQAIREQARVLDLLGRLLGELGSGAAVHLHAHRHEVAATALVTPAAVEHLAGVALDWAERHRAPETVPLLESADE